MSGHSKWATTKHKKALVDSKRAKVFTKLQKIINIQPLTIVFFSYLCKLEVVATKITLF